MVADTLFCQLPVLNEPRLTATAELGRTVLAVDDEESILVWLARSLGDFGYEVIKAPDRASAHAMLQCAKIDALILDLRLARGSGLEVLEFVRAQRDLAGLPVIILTGVSHLTPEEEHAIRRHQAHVLYKPEGIDSIAETLERLLRNLAN